MPITIERFISLILAAELSIEKLDLMHEQLERIKENIGNLRQELPEGANYSMDLAWDIENAVDVALKANISQQMRKDLMFEKAKMQVNEKKNRSQRLKKQIQRGKIADDEADQQLREEWARLDAEDAKKLKIVDDEPVTTGTDADTYDPPNLMPKKVETI